jgi:hypothetical protein
MAKLSYAEARSYDRRLPFPASLDQDYLIHVENDRGPFIFNEETQQEKDLKVIYPGVNDPELHYPILPTDYILSVPKYDKVVNGHKLVAVLVFHERYGTNVMPFFVNVDSGEMFLSGLPWCIDYPQALAFERTEKGIQFLYRSETFNSVWEQREIPESWFS